MRLIQPPFGALLWDGYAWEGDVRLPCFARLEQSLQAVPPLQREEYAPPIRVDVFPLSILTQPGHEPSPAQANALRWLHTHEPVVCLAALAALLQAFRRYGEPAWRTEGTAETFLQLLHTLEGIRQSVRLVGVTIFDDHETLASIGYEFAADWASTMGLAVRMRGTAYLDDGLDAC